MDSEDYVFDTVKFEKMKAMERYNRFRKIMKLMHVFEVLVALVLISWSSTYLPTAVKISGSFVLRFSDYVFKPHVVFLIGNAIVVALVVLCRETDAGNHRNSGSGDLYDDYVRHLGDQPQRRVAPVSDADKSTPVEEEKFGEEKQIVCVSPVKSELKETEEEKCEEKEAEKMEEEEEEERKGEEEKSAAVVTAVDDARKEIQKFQRTQSARLKREIAVMPAGELRRAETYRRRAVTSFDSVDSLSNEEFNLTVAAFIKRHQEFLMEQKLAENYYI